MNTSELRYYVDSDPFLRNKVSVGARDTLPFDFERPHGFIINSDPTGKDGKHWLAIFAPSSNATIEYFDSYGNRPLEQDVEPWLLKHGRKTIFTGVILQDRKTTVCGYWALLFQRLRFRGESYNSILDRMERYHCSPDCNVYELISKVYQIPKQQDLDPCSDCQTCVTRNDCCSRGNFPSD